VYKRQIPVLVTGVLALSRIFSCHDVVWLVD
jgi:hypothetical protein